MNMKEGPVSVQMRGTVTNPPILQAARRDLGPRFYDEFVALYPSPTAQQLIQFLNEVRNGSRI